MIRVLRSFSAVIVVASMLFFALLWTCSALMTLFGLCLSQKFRGDDSTPWPDRSVPVKPLRTIGRYRS